MDHDAIYKLFKTKRIVNPLSSRDIDYNIEFEPELICCISMLFWLKSAGLLEGKKVKIFSGIRSLYYFLSDHEIVQRDDTRHIHPEPYRLPYLANRQEHYTMKKTHLEANPLIRGNGKNNIFFYDYPIFVIKTNTLNNNLVHL